MPCSMHPAASVTALVVPIEMMPSEGASPVRIVGAVLLTCGQCSASWYDWDAVACLPVQTMEQTLPDVASDC